jgi:hypothetical protein
MIHLYNRHFGKLREENGKLIRKGFGDIDFRLVSPSGSLAHVAVGLRDVWMAIWEPLVG